VYKVVVTAMATNREEADRFLSRLEMNYDRTGQRRGFTTAIIGSAPDLLIRQGNDNDDRTHRNVPEAPLTSTIDDRYHRSHYTVTSRPRATSTLDYYDSRPMGAYQDFPTGNTTVGQRSLEARRGRGRSKSRSPVCDTYRPRREASWDHEWIHDRYCRRDTGLPRHGEVSGSEFGRSQIRQQTLPDTRVETRNNPHFNRQQVGEGWGPSTHAQDVRMSKHQEPIKPTEDKRKTTKKPLFSGSQENIVTHKLLVDTNEKAKHTIFENKRQLAGHASYSHRPRGQDRAAYNASFEPVKKARLFDAEREPQIGSEPLCGVESHCQDESDEHEITAKITEEPEAAVARLHRVLTKMHADVTKLKRRDTLFTLINHRRKLWLNEIDLQIDHERSIMRDIIALPATLRFDKLRQQTNTSHSQQCINIRNDIRARMERTIIETIRMVIEMPKWDLLTDTVSEGIMNLLDQQKGQMAHEMEQREAAKKRTFLSEMQAFTDQENGRMAREMQERGAKKERAV